MKENMKLFGMFLLGSILICALVIASFKMQVDAEGATKTLSDNGYSEIEITGYRFFMKSKDDWYCTGFRAKSPANKEVTGAVTRGFFSKGSTIRFD